MPNDLNSDIIIAAFTATLVVLILSSFGIIFTIIYKKKQHAFKIEKEITQAQFRQQILQSQLEIQEQTLQHVSNELHDNIAQIASIIKMNLHTIKLDNISKAEQKLEDIKDLTRQLISDVKGLSINLNGELIAQIGLYRAIEVEVDRINKTELFNASFDKDGDLVLLDNDKAIILYRMIQEIINNIVKHSNANEIKLKLFTNENFITLALSDNGNGFNVDEKLKNGTSSGLYNLHKRAKLINAKLTINSVINEGTNVTIELPYNASSNLNKTSFD